MKLAIIREVQNVKEHYETNHESLRYSIRIGLNLIDKINLLKSELEALNEHKERNENI